MTSFLFELCNIWNDHTSQIMTTSCLNYATSGMTMQPNSQWLVLDTQTNATIKQTIKHKHKQTNRASKFATATSCIAAASLLVLEQPHAFHLEICIKIVISEFLGKSMHFTWK